MNKKELEYIKGYGVCMDSIPIRDSDLNIEKKFVSLGRERKETFGRIL